MRRLLKKKSECHFSPTGVSGVIMEEILRRPQGLVRWGLIRAWPRRVLFQVDSSHQLVKASLFWKCPITKWLQMLLWKLFFFSPGIYPDHFLSVDGFFSSDRLQFDESGFDFLCHYHFLVTQFHWKYTLWTLAGLCRFSIFSVTHLQVKKKKNISWGVFSLSDNYSLNIRN